MSNSQSDRKLHLQQRTHSVSYSAKHRIESSLEHGDNSAKKSQRFRRQSISSNRIIVKRESGLSKDEIRQVQRIKSILSSLRDEESIQGSRESMVSPNRIGGEIISEGSGEESEQEMKKNESKPAIRYSDPNQPLRNLQEVVRKSQNMSKIQSKQKLNTQQQSDDIKNIVRTSLEKQNLENPMLLFDAKAESKNILTALSPNKVEEINLQAQQDYLIKHLIQNQQYRLAMNMGARLSQHLSPDQVRQIPKSMLNGSSNEAIMTTSGDPSSPQVCHDSGNQMTRASIEKMATLIDSSNLSQLMQQKSFRNKSSNEVKYSQEMAIRKANQSTEVRKSLEKIQRQNFKDDSRNSAVLQSQDKSMIISQEQRIKVDSSIERSSIRQSKNSNILQGDNIKSPENLNRKSVEKSIRQSAEKSNGQNRQSVEKSYGQNRQSIEKSQRQSIENSRNLNKQSVEKSLRQSQENSHNKNRQSVQKSLRQSDEKSQNLNRQSFEKPQRQSMEKSIDQNRQSVEKIQKQNNEKTKNLNRYSFEKAQAQDQSINRHSIRIEDSKEPATVRNSSQVNRESIEKSSNHIKSIDNSQIRQSNDKSYSKDNRQSIKEQQTLKKQRLNDNIQSIDSKQSPQNFRKDSQNQRQDSQHYRQDSQNHKQDSLNHQQTPQNHNKSPKNDRHQYDRQSPQNHQQSSQNYRQSTEQRSSIVRNSKDQRYDTQLRRSKEKSSNTHQQKVKKGESQEFYQTMDKQINKINLTPQQNQISTPYDRNFETPAIDESVYDDRDKDISENQQPNQQPDVSRVIHNIFRDESIQQINDDGHPIGSYFPSPNVPSPKNFMPSRNSPFIRHSPEGSHTFGDRAHDLYQQIDGTFGGSLGQKSDDSSNQIHFQQQEILIQNERRSDDVTSNEVHNENISSSQLHIQYHKEMETNRNMRLIGKESRKELFQDVQMNDRLPIDSIESQSENDNTSNNFTHSMVRNSIIQQQRDLLKMLEDGSNHQDTPDNSKPLTSTNENKESSVDLDKRRKKTLPKKQLHNQDLLSIQTPNKNISQNSFLPQNKNISHNNSFQSKKKSNSTQKSALSSRKGSSDKPYTQHVKPKKGKSKKSPKPVESEFMKEFKKRNQIDLQDLRTNNIHIIPKERDRVVQQKKQSIFWGTPTPGGVTSSSESQGLRFSQEEIKQEPTTQQQQQYEKSYLHLHKLDVIPEDNSRSNLYVGTHSQISAMDDQSPLNHRRNNLTKLQSIHSSAMNSPLPNECVILAENTSKSHDSQQIKPIFNTFNTTAQSKVSLKNNFSKIQEILGNMQMYSTQVRSIFSKDEHKLEGFMPQMESKTDLKKEMGINQNKDEGLLKMAEAFSKEAQKQIDMRKKKEEMGIYKLNAKGVRVDNYDSDTAEKIKKFNLKNKMSPVSSPEQSRLTQFDSAIIPRPCEQPVDPLGDSSQSESMLIQIKISKKLEKLPITQDESDITKVQSIIRMLKHRKSFLKTLHSVRTIQRIYRQLLQNREIKEYSRGIKPSVQFLAKINTIFRQQIFNQKQSCFQMVNKMKTGEIQEFNKQQKAKIFIEKSIESLLSDEGAAIDGPYCGVGLQTNKKENINKDGRRQSNGTTVNIGYTHNMIQEDDLFSRSRKSKNSQNEGLSAKLPKAISVRTKNSKPGSPKKVDEITSFNLGSVEHSGVNIHSDDGQPYVPEFAKTVQEPKMKQSPIPQKQKLMLNLNIGDQQYKKQIEEFQPSKEGEEQIINIEVKISPTKSKQQAIKAQIVSVEKLEKSPPAKLNLSPKLNGFNQTQADIKFLSNMSHNSLNSNQKMNAAQFYDRNSTNHEISPVLERGHITIRDGQQMFQGPRLNLDLPNSSFSKDHFASLQTKYTNINPVSENYEADQSVGQFMINGQQAMPQIQKPLLNPFSQTQYSAGIIPGFSVSANAGGFYQTHVSGTNSEQVSQYQQNLIRMMQNQTYHAGATGGDSILEQSEEDVLEKKKIKKSTKHLKKKKVRKSTERYDADDVYDPDSDGQAQKMKKRRFNTIAPATTQEKKVKKLPFPVPNAKILGAVKLRKQNQFLGNLQQSEYKNMPLDLRRKATQLKITEDFLQSVSPKKQLLKSEKVSQKRIKEKILKEKEEIRKSYQNNILEQEQLYHQNKAMIQQEQEKIKAIQEQLLQGGFTQLVQREEPVRTKGFKGSKVKNLLTAPRKSEDLFLPQIVNQQAMRNQNHQRFRSMEQ